MAIKSASTETAYLTTSLSKPDLEIMACFMSTPRSLKNLFAKTIFDFTWCFKKSSDSFALFGVRASSNEVESEMIRFTMICRSWKIRDDDGKLRLPTPREDVLRRPSRLEDEPSAEQEGEELMDEDEQSTILTEEGGGASSCSSNKSKKRKKRKY